MAPPDNKSLKGLPVKSHIKDAKYVRILNNTKQMLHKIPYNSCKLNLGYLVVGLPVVWSPREMKSE